LIWDLGRAYNLATFPGMSNDIYVNERPRGPSESGGPGGFETALTLALDTATESRSVAVLRGGESLVQVVRGRREAGASTVLADVDEALGRAGVRLDEVGLLAAAAGPGSFTGVRAGLATLKAFAETLGRRAVGVPTLHALAHRLRAGERSVALIPAGRGEVFAQELEGASSGGVRELGPPRHVSPEALLREAGGGPLRWVAAGGEGFAERLGAAARAAGLSFRLEDEEGRTAAGGESAGGGTGLTLAVRGALAESVGLLARQWVASGRAGRRDALNALYVRPSDAELKG
jgi:tRNA threonylcarbamoyladenosine biosynthesis protein TsaB